MVSSDTISLSRVRALIPAAGRGTRAGLPYPKTLYPVNGSPILIRILRLLHNYDPKPTVVVSSDGRESIEDCLVKNGMNAHIVLQEKQCGMGNAVMEFKESPVFNDTEHVILLWGDIPFLNRETLEKTISIHLKSGNDFTFPTRKTSKAYSEVLRDVDGRLEKVVETREEGLTPRSGEREIGLFIFRNSLVINLLRKELPGKYGKMTGEHGFLYLIEHLVRRKYKVEALPIATALDLVSLNYIEDLNKLTE